MMLFFFNRIGLERVGIVGPEPGLLWTSLKDLDRRAGPGLLLGWSARSVCGSPCRKEQERRRGRQGLCQWPLRCLSQFLVERKDRLLRGRMFLCPFHRWGGLVFIVDVLPVGW